MMGLRDMVVMNLIVIEYGFTHWKEIVEWAALKVSYWVVRLTNEIQHHFTVRIPTFLKWFSENWRDVLMTAYNFIRAFDSNVVKNLTGLSKAIIGFFKGEGFHFEWTGLLEGFENTIKQMPNIAEREVGALEKALGDSASAVGSGLATGLGKFVKKRWAEYNQTQKDTDNWLDSIGKGMGGLTAAVPTLDTKPITGPAQQAADAVKKATDEIKESFSGKQIDMRGTFLGQLTKATDALGGGPRKALANIKGMSDNLAASSKDGVVDMEMFRAKEQARMLLEQQRNGGWDKSIADRVTVPGMEKKDDDADHVTAGQAEETNSLLSKILKKDPTAAIFA